MDGGPENEPNVLIRVYGDGAEYWDGRTLEGTVGSAAKAIRGGRSDDDSGPTVVELD